MQFLAPTQTSPRPILSRTRALQDHSRKTAEAAKNILCERLSFCTTLSYTEKVVLQRLGDALLAGDLNKLQKAVSSLVHCQPRWREIVAVMRGELNTTDINIQPLQVVRENEREIAVLTIHIVSAKRLLVIATDERFGVIVCGRGPGGVTEELTEEPHALLKMIAKSVTIELAGMSALMYGSY
jgi:hypothetical protein